MLTRLAFPTSAALVRTSPPWRTQTPEPRRVPDSSRALTATIENPSAAAFEIAFDGAATVVAGAAAAGLLLEERLSVPDAASTTIVASAPATPASTGANQRPAFFARVAAAAGSGPRGSSLGCSQIRSRGWGGPPARIGPSC